MCDNSPNHAPLSRDESVADLVHDVWCGWMNYMFSKSVVNADGSVTIPADLVERWKRQANTIYEHLPENEKQSDKTIAAKYVELLHE